MNIDKIYKPLRKYNRTFSRFSIPDANLIFVDIDVWDDNDVQGLEEKYKELLEDYIRIVKSLISDWVCSEYQCTSIFEKQLGMKWEDIISED